ncbi:MAG: radical SAM protein [Candidatus Aenigmatarchaeota archaeon]
MKILLINSPFRVKISKDSRWPEYTKSGTLYYPFWLAYATAVIMEKGEHKPLLIDAIAKKMSFEESMKKVKKFNPDLVVIETSTPTAYSDVKFAELIKEELGKDVYTALSGTLASSKPFELIKMSESIDFVIRGEYDYTVNELATVLENEKKPNKVLGLTYRNKKEILNTPPRPLVTNLDIIPFVSKAYKKFLNIFDYRYALARYPMIQIWTSRGCPARCNFCQYPQSFTMHLFRARSPKNVVDEMEYIIENFPAVKEIFFEDDTFTINQNRVIEICKEIKERGLHKSGVVWSCNVRVQTKYETLKAMKDAGCRIVIVGYESGNDQVLSNIRKGATVREAKRFTVDAKKAGLRIFGCFMIGLAGDTRESIMDTLKLAKKLNPDMAFFQQAVPFPGTEFYEWAKMNGYLITEDWSQWLDSNGRLRCLVSYPWLKAEEIDKLRDKLMLEFYMNPKHIAQTIIKNLHPLEASRVALYAFEYLKYLIKRKFSPDGVAKTNLENFLGDNNVL